MRIRHLTLVLGLVACGINDDPVDPTASAEVSDTAASSSEQEDTGADPCDTAPEVSWSGWAQGFFRGYCTSCHSVDTPDRWGAPEGLDFDSEEDVAGRKQQIQSAVLDSDRMPVGGGVIEADLELLQIFLSCGL
jgi:uncharacterized membrane protein